MGRRRRNAGEARDATKGSTSPSDSDDGRWGETKSGLQRLGERVSNANTK
jgi:hypothetical protein